MRGFVLLGLLTILPSAAHAQLRGDSERARMELAFDSGYGGGSEGGYLEIGTDFRVWSPSGLGAIVRVGLASNVFSNAFATDAGAGFRFDLARGTTGGLQLASGIGASYARGPFDGDRNAFGGFALLGFDGWHRNFFAGVGVSAHLLWTLGSQGEGARTDPIWTLTPMLRIGGDWGL
jgi:hypothetical protein